MIYIQFVNYKSCFTNLEIKLDKLSINFIGITINYI